MGKQLFDKKNCIFLDSESCSICSFLKFAICCDLYITFGLSSGNYAFFLLQRAHQIFYTSQPGYASDFPLKQSVLVYHRVFHEHVFSGKWAACKK